uniref:Uncharacterized protein n=1 Tax=Romanomermis culicivorax TaxID=13658 RepID=A0A915KR93_ROMCU
GFKPGSYFCSLLGEHSSEQAARRAWASRTPNTKKLITEHARGSRKFFYYSEHARRVYSSEHARRATHFVPVQTKLKFSFVLLTVSFVNHWHAY